MSMQRGRTLEKLIGEFSSRFFMKDFVWWDVKYISGGKLKQHPADLLLVLDRECIVVSVKGTDGKTKAPDRLKLWLEDKVWDGSKSAKTGMQRLKKLPFHARNLWDEPREFSANALIPTCGICLVECTQELFLPIDFQMRQPDSDIPIHVLSVNDLMNMVMSLGSIWDVFDYLKRRASIRSIFSGINQERPALAFYALRAKDFAGFASEDKVRLRNLHQLYMLENLVNYAEREERLAGWVNAVIHGLHTRHPEMESFTPPELKQYREPKEARRSYLQMAAMLNGLPMSMKANIGREVQAMVQTLRGSGKCGCKTYRRLNEECVFVFACFSQMSRTERIRSLHELVAAALYRYETVEALGVAYDADDDNSGFDVLFWHGAPLVNADTVRLADSIFGPPETLIANPFGKARPYSPTPNPRARGQL
jgi:hypothetical protein